MVKVRKDGKVADVLISAAMTARDLETLLADLAVARASMDPPVPFEPPTRHDLPDADQRISEQEKPYFQARALKDGRIRIYMRHMGFGWMIFNLAPDAAASLRDYLIANTPDATSGLFGEDGGDGTAPH